MTDERVAIVICSMDSNSDLWPLLDGWYSAYTSNFDIFIVANHVTAMLNHINVLNIGDDTSWSECLRKGLEKLEHNVILVTFDDLLPTQFRPSNPLRELGYFREHEELDAIRFARSSVKHQRLEYGEDHRKVAPGQRYYFSLVFTMWRRERLIELLDQVGSCNPWTFENNDARHLQARFTVVSAWPGRQIAYLNCLIKGLWDPAVLRNPNVRKYASTTARGVLQGRALAILRLKQVWYMALHFLR